MVARYQGGTIPLKTQVSLCRFTSTLKFDLSSADYAMEKEARYISPEAIKVLAGTADLAVKIGSPSGKS